MEFRIEISAILIKKYAKREITEGIGLLSLERTKALGQKVNYKYLAVLEAKRKHQKNRDERIK